MTTSLKRMQRARVATPIGTALLYAVEDAVCALDFESDRSGWVERLLEQRFGPLDLQDSPDPGGAAGSLAAYFDGELAALDTLRVDLGGTEFQRLVWAALRT